MAKPQKVYDIRFKNLSYGGDLSLLLEDVEAVDFMGLACLKGINRTWKEIDWGPGTMVYVPISEIQRIHEFESLAAFQEENKRCAMARAKSSLS